jgi:hypothetical protein
MVRFDAGANYRVSKRGLVLAGAGGEAVLFEHPRRYLSDSALVVALAEKLHPVDDH